MNKQKIKEFAKKHKNEIMITGGVIAGLSLIAIGYKGDTKKCLKIIDNIPDKKYPLPLIALNCDRFNIDSLKELADVLVADNDFSTEKTYKARFELY